MSGFIILLTVFTVTVIFMILKMLFWKTKLQRLDGKHVLVTGGSSGIGKSVAIECARLGANVTIIARRLHALESAVDEISQNCISENQKINHVSLDVSGDYTVMEEKIVETEEKIGPIFMLINCAGKAVCNKFESALESDFREMLDVNYFGAVYPTQIVGKLMRQRREGHIVLCGSQASLLGIFGMSAYCGSKFALRGYAESLYMEMIPYNVSVTLCLPPDTNTPGFEKENMTKPEETKLISQSAGLFEPSEVARQLLVDSLNKSFFSTVGVESFLLRTLCSGMSPYSSFSELFLQISLMSFFRLLGVCYLLHFRSIILSLHSSSHKKSE